MPHTVTQHNEQTATAHGVYLLNVLVGGTEQQVVAISYWDGSRIRVGHVLWVLAELRHMQVTLITNYTKYKLDVIDNLHYLA